MRGNNQNRSWIQLYFQQRQTSHEYCHFVNKNKLVWQNNQTFPTQDVTEKEQTRLQVHSEQPENEWKMWWRGRTGPECSEDMDTLGTSSCNNVHQEVWENLAPQEHSGAVGILNRSIRNRKELFLMAAEEQLQTRVLRTNLKYFLVWRV